jgi:hypothetical protein
MRSRALDGRRGSRLSTNSVYFHDHIGGSADQQKMFDIVATDQNEAAARIDDCRIEYGKTRLASSPATGGRSACAPELPDKPSRQTNQRKNKNESENKSRRQSQFAKNITHYILPPCSF